MTADEVMLGLKSRLQARYGSRLQGLVLHGSAARGDAGPESDLDVLVLLDHLDRPGAELRAIVRELLPLELQADCLIDALPVDAEQYRAATKPLYRRAQREGRPL